MMEAEVVALLPPEVQADGRAVAVALVRHADGRMDVRDLCEDSARGVATRARFRRSSPILDPSTREVIGYEMERVLLAVGG
jgi:hypothetical protein